MLGRTKELNWFRGQISGRYTVKFRGRLGPGAEDDNGIRILNRVASWKDNAIEFEADQRHAELIIKHLGLGSEKAKSVGAPGQKRTSEDEDEEEELTGQECTKYRALVARAMFLAQDRSDIGFAVKELSRWMQRPKIRNMKGVKNARDVFGREREDCI